jgi:phage/conjugal plasmid C-4 type zinc finger TraR family protein
MDEIDLVQNNEVERMEALLKIRRLEKEKLNKLGIPKIRFCDQCGDNIPPARLKLVPHAKLCVDCQSSQEGRK